MAMSKIFEKNEWQAGGIYSMVRYLIVQLVHVRLRHNIPKSEVTRKLKLLHVLESCNTSVANSVSKAHHAQTFCFQSLQVMTVWWMCLCQSLRGRQGILRCRAHCPLSSRKVCNKLKQAQSCLSIWWDRCGQAGTGLGWLGVCKCVTLSYVDTHTPFRTSPVWIDGKSKQILQGHNIREWQS